MPQLSAAADDGASPEPQRLGKLTLLRKIGAGGMATIHLARARSLGGFEKLVVVKRIHPHLAEDADFISRFLQEARLSATLDHPNITAVHDVDDVDGTVFFSMEYVRGRDLRKLIRRANERQRALTFSEAVGIMIGLCAGLHHAHTRRDPSGRPLGIVHRDVSPSNVLVSYDGAVKLADFGVAKARDGIATTSTGTLRGKLPYMSPEQCSAEALDGRSDVYAAGAVLWELLTRRRMHRSDSGNELGLLRQITEHDAPPVTTLRPETPAELSAIVAKAVARSPARRYQSADALRMALEDFASETGLNVSARPLAALMADLFAEELEADDAAIRRPATIVANLGSAEEPATATMGSAKGGGPDEPAAGPTAEVAPPRRGVAGVVAGVVLGVVVGGGSAMYIVASQPKSEAAPARAEPRRAAPLPEAPRPPSAAAGVERAEPEPDVPQEASDPTPAKAARARRLGSRRKRGRRRGRDKKPAEKLDLDAALPPGFATK